MSDFEKYYLSQAGSGLHGFQGIRFQRGHGFFGRLISGAVFPLLKFLGKNLLKTGSNIASDVFSSNDFSMDNIKKSAKDNLKKQSIDILDQLSSKMKGSGRRKRNLKYLKNELFIKRKKFKRNNQSIKGSRKNRRKKSRRNKRKRNSAFTKEKSDNSFFE